MSGLRVLITNTTLATRTGTEVYVRDLALGLLARGHTPMVYSRYLGAVARELRAAGVPAVDRLARLPIRPDVIHGHHNVPTMAAFLHFPGVPGIFVCHDRVERADVPPHFPRIRCYVAVDHVCRDRLLEHGIPQDRIRLVFNAVDLARFTPRGPLPECPQRALVFSNYASERTQVRAVRQACERTGMALDVLGSAAGNPCDRPEAILGQYDLVFAKGRCALEALAVGTAVILCDSHGVGPMVTAAEVGELRRFNFGRQTLRAPLRPEILEREISRYDPRDAAAVSGRVRESAGLELLVEQLVAFYREVLAEQERLGGSDVAAEARVAAAYLSSSRAARLRDWLKRVPVLGPQLLKLKRAVARRAETEER